MKLIFNTFSFANNLQLALTLSIIFLSENLKLKIHAKEKKGGKFILNSFNFRGGRFLLTFITFLISFLVFLIEDLFWIEISFFCVFLTSYLR